MTITAFFLQAEDGIRDGHVTGVQTCALPICTEGERHRGQAIQPRVGVDEQFGSCPGELWMGALQRQPLEIGRASCRERGEISVVSNAVNGNKKRIVESVYMKK